MFTVAGRERLRQQIIERAEREPVVTGCTILGSAARGEEDAWSDIDIALSLSRAATVETAADDWTSWLRTVVSMADTLDIHASGALYRVFLLADSLQVDMSFWPQDQFRSTGEPVHVVFGQSPTPGDPSRPDHLRLIRMGWLYALHARSAVARNRHVQADMMLTDLRDQIVALACIRHGLNPAQGRDAHRLPADLAAELIASRASSLTQPEQQRSLRATIALYRAEAARHDPELAASLDTAINTLQQGGRTARRAAPRTPPA